MKQRTKKLRGKFEKTNIWKRESKGQMRKKKRKKKSMTLVRPVTQNA